jgi:hypothetical protein
MVLRSSESFVLPYVIKNAKIQIYKSTILPVTLYDCENYSLTLTEEDNLGCSVTVILGEYLDLRGIM